MYHNYFAMLKEAGVKNILVMSHRYLYPIEMIEPDYNGVIPDPEEQPDEYMAFMNLFRDCYSTLAEEFPEITLWEPNNETDHEKGTTIVRDGYSRENSQSGNAPYLYSPEEVAKITLDMCYYANLGIKEHNPENELVMPGLVFSSTSASSIFIELLYEQIESGELPTSMDENGDRILPRRYKFGQLFQRPELASVCERQAERRLAEREYRHVQCCRRARRRGQKTLPFRVRMDGRL